MEKSDLFRNGVLVWLVLLSVGEIWQFNAIKKLSMLQTQTPMPSDSSPYEHHEEYQYEDKVYEVYEPEIQATNISHVDVEREFDADVKHHAHDDTDHLVRNQKRRALQKSHDVREIMNLSRLSVKKSRRRINENTDKSKKNIDRSLRDFRTTCVLLNTNDEQIDNENDPMTEFFLGFQLMTDAHPQTSIWSLSPDGSNDIIFDSFNERLTAANTLHTFNYRCAIMSDEEEGQQDQTNDITEPFCYNFYMQDSYGAGNCCENGFGWFELNISNSTTPLIHDRLYSFEMATPFCIDRNGSLISKNMKEKDKEDLVSKYPSRECMNNQCVCDSNPALFIGLDDSMHAIKLNVMFQMMSLSGSEKLLDINTSQYKAACWVLKDDPYFSQHDTSNIPAEQIEKQMIQRYILALFYFATTGESWANDFHFLSSQSECEWNYRDDNDYGYSFIEGSLCDEDENVMSIIFAMNNLDGTLIEELYGLRKLEQLYLRQHDKLHGTIPPSLGRLPELHHLNFFGSSLEGTISPEIFQSKSIRTLFLAQSYLSGTIPEEVGNLKQAVSLSFVENQLTGSIPESIYSISSLVFFALQDNHLSSTISPKIGNLKRLRMFFPYQNELTGEIPSTIENLERLEIAILNHNKLSGSIPSGIESLSNLYMMTLHDNLLRGAVSDGFCDQDIFFLSADCRNDVFASDVSCSCCDFCTDQTPQWNGECADSAITIEFDHIRKSLFDANSDGLVWSLIDESIGDAVLYDGPYNKRLYNNDKPSYKACAVNTGCYSLIMKSRPVRDVNYTIFWNDELIHSGTFLGFLENDGVNKNDKKTMLTFHYDAQVGEIVFNDTTCNNVQLTCGDNNEKILIEQNTTERLMYSTAVEISGLNQIQNTSSFQSQALCWILQHEYKQNNTNKDTLQTRFTQRYVLTILHLMSLNGLFSFNEYPPLSDECNWEGIQCKDNNTGIVTTISLSSNRGQIIDGPLIKEIGSLAFVEFLCLNRTKLTGSIPLLLSNMWSLTELDLSSNALTGSIPDSLFDQLTHLKYLNLSNNTLTSSIPKNIGSYSEISTIILSGNQLIGSVPLGNFKWHSLEHLDISENELNGIDLSLLLGHTKFNTINLAANFFVGELQEDVFMFLPKLNYFNVSQNEIGGVIPSSVPDNSNMTHLDIHDNRFSGTVPQVLSDLGVLQHLNLQGNKLTGSIPGQLNKLKSLKLLALSNNELKGSISIDIDSLPDLDSLYLHNNKLSGEAPAVNTKDKKMKMYTSDCGFPSDSLEPVSCSSCNICCNSDNECQKKPDETIRSSALTLIFIFSVLAFIFLLYILKDYITSSWLLRQYFENSVKNWNALLLISDKSVYQFMLTKNKVGWVIAFSCSIVQMLTLFLFVSAADIQSESGDLVYTMTCPSNSLECDDAESVSPYGIWIFSFILATWLLRDIASSVKLMLLSFEKRNIDFLLTAGVVFLVTILSAWTSIYYNMALATKNTELIVNAVILLFVIEIDEKLYQLSKIVFPNWVVHIEEDPHNYNLNGDDLVLSSAFGDISNSFVNLKRKISDKRLR